MLTPHTDGCFYDLYDMAKAGSSDCKGCSACCENMGNSIRIDPYDMYHLEKELQMNFEELMSMHIELHVYEGMILPNLKMTEKENACSFLKDHRCSIHSSRPGLCRLFPLGRNYEDGKLNYILLKDTCNRQMTKVKVSKWIGIDDIEKYHQFVIDWHYFQKDMQAVLQGIEDEATAKKINLYLLHQFFQLPYNVTADFFQQFYERLQLIRDAIG